MTNLLEINLTRLIQRLDQLAQIGALPGGGVSRLTFTDADKQARNLLVSWMQTAGLTVQVDRVGNIFGARLGESDIPPVMFGSHIDTVSVAGRLDGSYGVLAALECLETLNDRQISTRRPLVMAAFTNEEGVRYTPGMLGSAVYAGDLSVEQALALEGFDGSIFGDELVRIGYAGPLEPGAVRPSAYVELHIEQGPLLDRERLPIGVVEAVVGITWLEVTVTGSANHAGTTPMDLRRDAGLAAAKIVAHLREIALSIGGDQRATCGMIAFEPNAINVIPGKAVLTVDLRNSDAGDLKQAEERLAAYAKEVEQSDDVNISIRPLEYVHPVRFDPDVVAAVEQAAREAGLPSRRMISGAGHDAQLMAHICPAAMIFVPSREGISHSPKEYTPPEELGTGANVLLGALLRLVNKGQEFPLTKHPHQTSTRDAQPGRYG